MLLASLILSIFHSISRSHIRNTSPFTCEPFCLLWSFHVTNPSNKSSKQSQTHNWKSKEKKETKYERQRKWKIMSIFRVFDMREKVIKKKEEWAYSSWKASWLQFIRVLCPNLPQNQDQVLLLRLLLFPNPCLLFFFFAGIFLITTP